MLKYLSKLEIIWVSWKKTWTMTTSILQIKNVNRKSPDLSVSKHTSLKSQISLVFKIKSRFKIQIATKINLGLLNEYEVVLPYYAIINGKIIRKFALQLITEIPFSWYIIKHLILFNTYPVNYSKFWCGCSRFWRHVS